MLSNFKYKFILFTMVTSALVPQAALAEPNHEAINRLRMIIAETERLCARVEGEDKIACEKSLENLKEKLNATFKPSQIAGQASGKVRLVEERSSYIEFNGFVLRNEHSSKPLMDYSVNSLQTREGNIVTGGKHDSPSSESTAAFTVSAGGGIKENYGKEAPVAPIASIKGGITTNKFTGTLDVVGGETVLRLNGTTQAFPIQLVREPIWANRDLYNLDPNDIPNLNVAEFKLQIVPLTAEGQMTFEKIMKKGSNGKESAQFEPTSYNFVLSPELQAQFPITNIGSMSSVERGGSFFPMTAMIEADFGPAVAIAHDEDGTAVGMGLKGGLSGQMLLGLGHGHFLDLGASLQVTPTIANMMDEKLSFSARTKGWAHYKRTFDSSGGTLFLGPEVEANVADVKKADGSSAQGKNLLDGTRVQGTVQVGYQGAIFE